MISRLERSKKIEKEIKKENRLEKKKLRKKRNKKLLSFLLGITLIFFIYSCFIEPNFIIVNEKVILNNNIKEDLHGIKIVHFSDLHYGSSINSKNIKKVITKINELKPDIVVFTGDLLDLRYTEKYTKKEIDVLTNALKDINASLGKYSIIGNHDYNYNELSNIYYNSNFNLLVNKNDIIYGKEGSTIGIYGFDNITYGSPNIEGLKDNSFNSSNLKIVLLHETDYIDYFINDYNIDVILGGHSHNGQVKIPFVRPIFLPDGAKKYYAPYYKINNTDIYISNGLGESIFNIRFNNIPSINFYRINKA